MKKTIVAALVTWCAMGLTARGEPGEIVVDSADKDCVTTEGAAKHQSPAPNHLQVLGEAKPIGGTTLNIGTWSRPNTDRARITVTPVVPKDGTYGVYVRWFSSPSNYFGHCAKTPLTVAYDGGTAQFTVSQQAGNAWVFFGVYPFKAGKAGSVSVTNEGTVGAINLDAVKLVPATTGPAKADKTLPVTSGKADTFDAVRVKLADMLTPALNVNEGDPEIDAKVREADFQAHTWWTLMNRSPEAKTLWPDNRVTNGTGGENVWDPYRRVNAMARAYVRSSGKYGFGQRMQGNEKLRDDILYALEWLNTHAFNEKTKNPAGAAWFANEIGIPRDLCEAVLLIYPHVPEAARQRYMAAVENMTHDPRKFYQKGFNSTGANRVWQCYVHVLRGLIEKDEARIKLSVEALDEPLTTLVRSEVIGPDGKAPKGKTTDGFYADGSFLQHGHLPYTTGYGNGMLNSFSRLVALLNGSPWEVTNPKRANIAAWVYNGLEPMIYRGDAFPRLMGRGASMQQGQNYGGGRALRTVLANLIPAMGPEDAANFKAMLKAWTLDDAYVGSNQKMGKKAKVADAGDLEILARTKAVLADAAIQPKPRPIQSRVFYNMDFVVHHRPGFAAALSMSSTRIATHECIWTANRKGWYQGDGMLMVYVPDPSRYNEDYWPTVNPYRLPGITVDTQVRQDGADGGANSGALSKSAWAGGVELGKHAASASMALMAQESSLRAKKSWFFFGDQIVCLGADITSTDNRTIETVVENAKLNAKGDNALVADGKVRAATLGTDETLEQVRWAALAGSAPGADMGWYFPEPVGLRALREARTGTWEAIYKLNDDIPVTRNYLTLLFDHGKNPAKATYQYVILPGKTAEQVQEYAAASPVKVLANTPEVQAAKVDGFLGINFWGAGAQECAGVRASGPAALVIEETAGEITVAVSDPTQLAGGVELTLPAKAGKLASKDEAIKVVSLDPLKVAVSFVKSDGKTLSASFQK